MASVSVWPLACRCSVLVNRTGDRSSGRDNRFGPIRFPSCSRPRVRLCKRRTTRKAYPRLVVCVDVAGASKPRARRRCRLLCIRYPSARFAEYFTHGSEHRRSRVLRLASSWATDRSSVNVTRSPGVLLTRVYYRIIHDCVCIYRSVCICA